MAMNRWVIFVELTDHLPDTQGIEPVDEGYIREKFDELSKELPASITLKIRGLTGPFAEYGKAAGAK